MQRLHGLPTKPVYRVTSSSPSVLNEDLVTRRHSVVFRDIDGSKIVSGEGGLSASGRHLFTIEGAVAKIEIFNAKNLSIMIRARILTSTIEVFKDTSDVDITLCPPRPSESDPSPLGTLQLDPNLSNVLFKYQDPRLIGSIVLAPSPVAINAIYRQADETTQRSSGFRNVRLVVGGFEDWHGDGIEDGQSGEFTVAQEDGSLHEDLEDQIIDSRAEQYMVSYVQDGNEGEDIRTNARGKWTVEAMGRKECGYPAMNA